MLKKLSFLFHLALALSGSAYASADSLRMRTVSSWPYSFNTVTAAASIGGHDYLLAGMGGGVFIFNIDSIDAPYKVSEVATYAERINDIAVDGNYAYLTAYDNGLWIIDISNPLNPYVTGNMILPSFIAKVSVKNNYAYLATSSNGVRIINVSDPYNPYEAAAILETDDTRGLAINDTLLYTASLNSALVIYNISDPLFPTEIGHNDTLGDLRYVCYRNNMLYTLNMSEIIIYDVSDPTDPKFLGNGGCGGSGISLSDTIAFTTFYSYYIAVNNIIDPTAPFLVKLIDVEDAARNTIVLNDHLFVSMYRLLRNYDISVLDNPTMISEYRCPTIFGSGAVKDSFAFMPSDCIHILKLTDSTFMSEVSNIKSLGSGFTEAYIQDSLAYLADYNYGLQVVNISDPYNPIVLDSVFCGGFINGLRIKDTFALIAQYNNIKVVNVANPSNIFVADSFITNDMVNNICIYDSLAYLANNEYGLRIYDISNLPAITEIGYYDTPGNALYVAVSDSFAYLSDSDSGLCILNVSQSTNPTLISSYQASGTGMLGFGGATVVVQDSLVYVAYDTMGVRVLNVSDPANPNESGFYRKQPWFPNNVGCSATGLAFSGNKIYVSYDQYGLQVFEYTSPSGVTNGKDEKTISAFLLKDAYPNPTRSKATISYQLPNKSAVKLNLYNVAGQLVQSINMGTQQPGYYNVPLKTDNLFSGVYFYKLSAGHESKTGKLVVLK